MRWRSLLVLGCDVLLLHGWFIILRIPVRLLNVMITKNSNGGS